jgi:hypothetical protein
MAFGNNLCEVHKALDPVIVDSGSIEMVDNFVHLGSCIAADSELQAEVSCHIGKASKAFGRPQQPIFQNRHLSITTKRSVYQAVILPILPILLYGVEAWTIMSNTIRRLDSFHNQCIGTIFGVTRYQQWQEHITSRQMSSKFGMN